MNVFYNTIVFADDLKKSRDFYCNVLGLSIETEYETIIFFENHFVLHSRESILNTVYKKSAPPCQQVGSDNILIYFETDDILHSFDVVSKSEAVIIHAPEKQQWGQTVFRFHDLDGHMVEIGEPLHLEYLKEK